MPAKSHAGARKNVGNPDARGQAFGNAPFPTLPNGGVDDLIQGQTAVSGQDHIDEETSEQLTIFCQTWGVDDATKNWLARLQSDVLTTVMYDFDDSSHIPPADEDRVMMLPSSTIVLTGVPLGYKKANLDTLLSRFGTIVSSKIANVGTIPASGWKIKVQLGSVEEARLVVEDMNFVSLPGSTSPLTVRYDASDADA